jgi:hypothetical protein
MAARRLQALQQIPPEGQNQHLTKDRLDLTALLCSAKIPNIHLEVAGMGIPSAALISWRNVS